MTSNIDKLPNITFRNGKIIKLKIHWIGFSADYK